MNYKYLLGSIFSIPLLPILYLQGKRIKKEVPDLPEAKGNEGKVYIQHSKPIKILLIGESTFAGVGVEEHKDGFPGAFAKQLASHYNRSVSWKVYARSGYNAKRVNYKILPKIEDQDVDLVLIGLGGNDSFELNRPNQWKKDIQILIKTCQDKFQDGCILKLV
ncbi:MAG: GDSL-type esterase/lipase family protein, partial [Bacteroidota bacterium]